MGRIFFFLLGVGVTVWVVVKGRQMLRKVTPAGMADQVQRKADSMSHQANDFVESVSEAMRSREAELRAELGLTQES